MEKCINCQWHKTNQTVIHKAILDLTEFGGYENLITDFELALCLSQGCNEPIKKYVDKSGVEVSRKARIQIRSEIGIAEFTRLFPVWEEELEEKREE